MTISKSEARRLAKSAAEMDARVLRGVLKIGPHGAKVDDTDVLEWLARYAGSEMLLIAAPVQKRSYFEDELKSCTTCGRDYKGDTCPHCAEVRARLRGI